MDWHCLKPIQPRHSFDRGRGQSSAGNPVPSRLRKRRGQTALPFWGSCDRLRTIGQAGGQVHNLIRPVRKLENLLENFYPQQWEDTKSLRRRNPSQAWLVASAPIRILFPAFAARKIRFADCPPAIRRSSAGHPPILLTLRHLHAILGPRQSAWPPLANDLPGVLRLFQDASTCFPAVP